MNVRRTVIGFAHAGAAAVMIEDQMTPKRCGCTQEKGGEHEMKFTTGFVLR